MLLRSDVPDTTTDLPLFSMQVTLNLNLRTMVFSAFGFGLLLGVVGRTLGAGVLGSSVFSDVPRGSYYDEAVGQMNAAGILKGSNGKFRPGDLVNRAEFAVSLNRLRSELLGLPLNEGTETPPPPPQSSSVWSEPSGETSSSVTPTSRSRRSKSTSSSSSKSSSSKQAEAGPQGALTFTVEKISIPESAKGVTFGVSRVEGDSDDVSVMFEALEGSAKYNEDFYKNTVELKFAQGEKTKTVQVLFINDEKPECAENFTYRLRDPKNGAVLGKIVGGTVTIIDNETGATGCSGSSSSSTSGGSSTSSSSTSSVAGAGEFNFAASGYAVDEKGGSLNVTMLRAGGSAGTVTVNYATTNGTAQSGSEYSNTTGTLTFAAGETSKSFTVPVLNNTAIGGNKTFKIILSVPTGGSTLGKTKEVTVTIVDDESGVFGSGSIKFSKATYDGTEGQGTIALIVQRVGGAKGVATVSYSTTSGTASGNDFTPISGTLTFQEGEASKELLLPVIQDSQSEGSETVFLNLGTPTGAGALSPMSATVTIYE